MVFYNSNHGRYNMTIIVYRDGVLAADTLVCEGPRRAGRSKKIGSVNGYLWGFSGDLARQAPFLRWLDKATTDHGDKWHTQVFDAGRGTESWEAIVVDPAGRGWTVETDGQPFTFETPFWCAGSGTPIAYGALAMGATAIQAVELAIKVDVWCGGDVTAIRHPSADVLSTDSVLDRLKKTVDEAALEARIRRLCEAIAQSTTPTNQVN